MPVPAEVRRVFNEWDARGRPPQRSIPWQRDRWLRRYPTLSARFTALPNHLDRASVRTHVLAQPMCRTFGGCARLVLKQRHLACEAVRGNIAHGRGLRSMQSVDHGEALTTAPGSAWRRFTPGPERWPLARGSIRRPARGPPAVPAACVTAFGLGGRDRQRVHLAGSRPHGDL